MRIGDFVRQGKIFTGRASMMPRAYDRALRHWPGAPMPFRRRAFRFSVDGFRRPLWARLGTTDIPTIAELFEQREYAPLFSRADFRPSSILDLGANVGYSVRLWAEAFPDARICAVEPELGNMAICEMNAQETPCPANVTLVRACALDRSGATTLICDGECEVCYRVSDDPHFGKTVPALTLPEIVEMANFRDPIGLLKCDVEGSESRIFKASSGWINSFLFLAVETHPPYGGDALAADIREAGGRHVVFGRARKPNGCEIIFATLCK